MSELRASVVVATFNRLPALVRLLGELGAQSAPPDGYEIVVVDDGSARPVRERLESLELPCALTVLSQPNSGAASARHRGALAARGDLLVLVDDDMQVGPDFVAEHLARHPPGTRRAVLGAVVPDDYGAMPLFERWHARMIGDLIQALERGRRPRGNDLYSGNVSLRRADYLAVGGFDCSLKRCEDEELGLRLERAGVELELAPRAWSRHASDHDSAEAWRRRAREYGQTEHLIARRFRDVGHADPWRFLFELHPLSRPLLWATVLAPRAGRPLADAAWAVSDLLGRLRLERAALAGATATFGLEYFRGVRLAAGSLPASLWEVATCRLVRSGPDGALRRFSAAVRADAEAQRRCEARYGHAHPSRGRLWRDLVEKVGLQELAAYRLMRLLRERGDLPAAKVVSRAIRHLWGSDIHWDAVLAPGVMLVHGMGLAVSHAARVGAGCILFQNVTLGMGIDPLTRATGAPTLEEGVHVGPGASLLGPITVGAGSKIAAGAVLTESVPEGSVVQAPAPSVRRRADATAPAALRTVR